MKPAAKPRRRTLPASSHARQPLVPTSDLINTLREIAKRDGVTATAGRLKLGRVTVHKLLSGERAPGWTALVQLYRVYPADFPYLKHLLYPDQLRGGR